MNVKDLMMINRMASKIFVKYNIFNLDICLHPSVVQSTFRCICTLLLCQQIIVLFVSDLRVVFTFQHIILAMKMAIAYFIPDTPKWVEIEVAKMVYKTKMALQNEVIYGILVMQTKTHCIYNFFTQCIIYQCILLYYYN